MIEIILNLFVTSQSRYFQGVFICLELFKYLRSVLSNNYLDISLKLESKLQISVKFLDFIGELRKRYSNVDSRVYKNRKIVLETEKIFFSLK